MSTSPVSIETIINHLDYGVNVVDRDFHLLFLNEATRKKWNLTPAAHYPFTCHELLFNNPNPCSNCPIKQMEKSGESFGQILGELNLPTHPNHRIKYHRLGDGRYVQTLMDVTRETELVRQVSLQSKETQAQNIILKRKRQELEEHSAFLNSVFNAIQSGIMVLDSALTLTVTSANQAMANFVGVKAIEELSKKKCYQHFGFQRRCPGCPIENFTSQMNLGKLRYHQKIGEHTLTEHYTNLSDGKVMLSFEDSTKRVGLLQQVKEHKEIIERQNQIFRSLLETSIQIQQAMELEEIFNYTLAQLGQLFFNVSFGVVLDGERPEILECAVFRGISDLEQQKIIEQKQKLLDPGTEVALEELSIQVAQEAPSSVATNWLILPMLGRERRIIGKLLIKGGDMDRQSKEIVSIFLEQVTAVCENKLLTRQLERMANTDALTGAYNRAYFSRELERSIENAARFPNIYFSIFLIDVNGLKRVNDVFGHEAGDEMIIRVAQLLTTICRKTDVVTRLGGDEFVVLCPSTNMAQAEHLRSRIREREAVTQMICKHPNGEEEIIQIRMSIGLASSEETLPDEVVKTADQRMYADKEAFYASRQRYR